MNNKRNKQLFAPLNKKLKTLYSKYKHNGETIKRLDKHLDNSLPKLMDNWDNVRLKSSKKIPSSTKLPKIEKIKINQSKEKKVQKVQKVKEIKQEFTNILENPTPLKMTLSSSETYKILCALSNNIFYLPNMKLYVKYENFHFEVIESKHVWVELTKKLLKTVKSIKLKNHKKIKLLNMIKNKTILNAEVHNRTLQFIYYFLSPLYLKNITEVKYFLIVLGDSILRKNKSDIHHYVNKDVKLFIDTIMDESKKYFKQAIDITKSLCYNSSVLQLKDGDLNGIRILTVNKNIINKKSWLSFIKYHLLDFIVSCCYLSYKFKSSEDFINLHSSKFNKTILLLDKTTDDGLVNNFIEERIIIKKGIHESNKKRLEDIVILWKKYLYDHNIPVDIIKYDRLGNLFFSKLPRERRKFFLHIESPFLNKMSKVKEFWNVNMMKDEDNYYTIHELVKIYELWLSFKNYKKCFVSEQDFEFIIKKCFIKTKILNKKVLQKYNFIWNKKQETNEFLLEYKDNNPHFDIENNNTYDLESIYNAYNEYTKMKCYIIIISKAEFIDYIKYISFKTVCVEI